MSNKSKRNSYSFLKPSNPILFVSNKGVSEIPVESIKIEIVGQKAFGLSCFPKIWTLPFFVVSHHFSIDYKQGSTKQKEIILNKWLKYIIVAANQIGINIDDVIIIRSSSCTEGMQERGKYYSREGMYSNLRNLLVGYLEKLFSDKSLSNEKIPLVIQKYAVPISAKGHVSNERRISEANRDWLGQFEDVKTDKNTLFTINLRNWRRKIEIGNLIYKPLLCNLSLRVSEVLKIPATWGYEQKLRLHFEWVWDGKRIYMVQVDQEHEIEGIDPTQVYKSRSTVSSTFTPLCLKQIKLKHAKKYKKIRNVFTYLKLGLPVTKLYVLEDQAIIDKLALGEISPELKSDIQNLVKGSLIIRMDIDTDDDKRLKLLPRTEEVRDSDKAIEWLKIQSSEIKKKVSDDVAFIFHTFIPATASAFALAAPNERKVQIEALWGIPEGLYYNAHDKYIVDTKTPRVEEVINKINQFSIITKRNYKHYFVSPDDSGRWTVKILRSPFDWRATITNQEWIKKIALESRLIAEKEGQPVSIMWFVDVTIDGCEDKVFPWYHEHYDPQKTIRARTQRTKTPFDITLNIRTSEDIDKLRNEVESSKSMVRSVTIQLQEEKLLRNKDTLLDIGELCQRIGAVIFLEGGVLSHAYYQLMNTNAIVEIVHPFTDPEDKRQFNKLVRDRIPDTIKIGGELANKGKLSGEFLLRALREKLIEEGIETLDAIDQDSIVSELADVCEVIDGILSQIGVDKDQLLQRQKQKRLKAGGFKEGIVLLGTRNPIPTRKLSKQENTLFENPKSNQTGFLPVDEKILFRLGHNIDKYTDRREHEAASETILRLNIPLVIDNWYIPTFEISNENADSNVQAKITGTRIGSKLQLELSIFSRHIQLTLPFVTMDPEKEKNS